MSSGTQVAANIVLTFRSEIPANQSQTCDYKLLKSDTFYFHWSGAGFSCEVPHVSPDLLALAFPAGGAQTALHVDLSGSDGSLTGALRQVLTRLH